MEASLQKDTYSVKVDATLLVNEPLADGIFVCSGTIQMPQHWKPETGEHVLKMADGRSATINVFEIRPKEKVAYFLGWVNQK